MIRPGALLRHSARGAGLKLPILKDGKIDIPPVEVSEPDSDPLPDLVRIYRIRKMTCLRPLNLLNLSPRSGIAPVRGTAERRHLATFSPQVGLTCVMIVRQA